jgi:hypothetical protein
MPQDEIDLYQRNLEIVRHWQTDDDFRRQFAERAARQRGDLVPTAAAKLVRAMPRKPASERGEVEDTAARRRQLREQQRRLAMQRDFDVDAAD